MFNEVGKVDDSKVSKIKTNMNTKIQEMLHEQLQTEDQRIYYGAIVRDNKSGEVLAIHNPLVPPIGPIYSGSEIYEKEDKRISDIGLGINTLDITSPINIYALAFEHLSLSTADYTLDKSFKHPGTNIL